MYVCAGVQVPHSFRDHGMPLCMYVCMYVCMSVLRFRCRAHFGIMCMYVCMYVWVCWGSGAALISGSRYASVYGCMYVCMYVCVLWFRCRAHFGITVCLCVCMYVCMYVCRYVWVCWSLEASLAFGSRYASVYVCMYTWMCWAALASESQYTSDVCIVPHTKQIHACTEHMHANITGFYLS